MVLLSSIPAGGETDVRPDIVIQLNFSSTLNPNTVFTRFVSLLEDGKPVKISCEQQGKTLFVTPQSLKPGTQYTLYVYHRNVLTGEQFTAADSTLLDRTYVIKFSTSLANYDVPQFEQPIYNTPITIQAEASLTDDGDAVLFTENPLFTVRFSDEITNCDVEQYAESLDGSIVNIAPSVQINKNAILLNLGYVEPNSFVTIVLRNITFKNCKPIDELVLHKFTQLRPSFGTLHMIKLQLGRVQKYLKDYEIVANILRQQQAYERLTGKTVLGLQSVDGETRERVLMLAKYYIIEDLILEKGYRQGDSINYTDMRVVYGDVNRYLLDYLKQEKEQLEHDLAQEKLSPAIATQGLKQTNWLNSVKYPSYDRGPEKWKS